MGGSAVVPAQQRDAAAFGAEIDGDEALQVGAIAEVTLQRDLGVHGSLHRR